MLFHRAKNMKVTWWQDPTYPDQQQPCWSSLNGSVLNIHCTALTWYHLTYLFVPLKKHLGGHSFQNVVEVVEAVVQWFHLPNPEISGEVIADPELFRMLFLPLP
jgi:hypothetical protein